MPDRSSPGERRKGRRRTPRKSEPGPAVVADPLEVVQEQLQRYGAIREHLALTAETTKDDSIRVRAFKVEMDAMVRQLELMQAAGLLPRELHQLGVAVDVRATAARLIAVLDDPRVPEEVRKAALEAISAGR